VSEIANFKYSGSFVQKNGGFDEDVKHLVQDRDCVVRFRVLGGRRENRAENGCSVDENAQTDERR